MSDLTMDRHHPACPTAVLPSTVMIEPTNRCNLQCPTCPTGRGLITTGHDMSFSDFAKIIDSICPTTKTLLLWGYGEPLLHKDIFRMVSYAKEKGIPNIKLSTNGLFLTKNIHRLLRSGLDQLTISLDGASQQTYQAYRKNGDFQSVVRAISATVEERDKLGITRPFIELQFIIMSHNEHELPVVERLAREWGVDRLVLKTVGVFPGDEHLVPKNQEYSRYRPQAVAQHCAFPWDFTFINADGNVNVCCYLRTDMGMEYVMGNVFSGDFKSVWTGEKYRSFRAKMLKDKSAIFLCSGCNTLSQLNYKEIDFR